MKSAQAMSERGEKAWVLIVDRGERESPCMNIQGGVCVCVKEGRAEEKCKADYVRILPEPDLNVPPSLASLGPGSDRKSEPGPTFFCKVQNFRKS